MNQERIFTVLRERHITHDVSVHDYSCVHAFLAMVSTTRSIQTLSILTFRRHKLNFLRQRAMARQVFGLS